MSNRKKLSPALTARRDQAIASANEAAKRDGAMTLFVDHAPAGLECCYGKPGTMLGKVTKTETGEWTGGWVEDVPRCTAPVGHIVTLFGGYESSVDDDAPVCDEHLHYLVARYEQNSRQTGRPVERLPNWCCGK